MNLESFKKTMKKADMLDVIVEQLDKRGICTSSGSACSAGLPMPSSVLMNMTHNVKIAEGSLRVTFGKENTVEDVERLVYALSDILGKR